MVRDRAEFQAALGMSDGFDPVRMIEFASARGHDGFVGLRYVDHGADWAELAFDPREDLMADAERGILSSGPIITLMDLATSLAIWVRRKMFEPQATLDLRIDYLRPARAGRTIHGRGECYRVTRKIAFVRGQAHDGDPGDPIAHVAGTFMLMGERGR